MPHPGTHIKSLLSVIIMLTAGFVVCAFCLHVTWIGDDIDYRYFIHTSIWSSWGPVDTPGRLLHSQVNHYLHVNGRAVAHTLVQLFNGNLGQTAFAVCNGIVYIIFGLLICRLGGLRRPLHQPITLAGIYALGLIVFATKMMPCTQIGFVWMAVITLCWLLLFYRLHRHKDTWLTIVAIALGIIAGNGQEAYSIGLSAALGIRWLRHRCRIPARQFAAMAAYWAGTLSVCLSPAVLSRADKLTVSLVDSLQYMAISLRASYILIAVIAWQLTKHRTSLRQIYRANALYLNAMFVLIAFNLAVGIYCNRQLFGIELMALLVTLRLVPTHRIAAPWAVVAIAAAALFVGVQWQCATKINRQFNDITRLFVANGGGNVYYDRTRPSESPLIAEFRYYEDIVANGWGDHHHSIQKYHHIKHPGMKALQIRPQWLADHDLIDDTVIQYAQNHYLVILHKNTHRAIAADMQNRITGHRYTDTLHIGRTVYENDSMQAIIIAPPSSTTRQLSLHLTQ